MLLKYLVIELTLIIGCYAPSEQDNLSGSPAPRRKLPTPPSDESGSESTQSAPLIPRRQPRKVSLIPPIPPSPPLSAYHTAQTQPNGVRSTYPISAISPEISGEPGPAETSSTPASPSGLFGPRQSTSPASSARAPLPLPPQRPSVHGEPDPSPPISAYDYAKNNGYMTKTPRVSNRPIRALPIPTPTTVKTTITPPSPDQYLEPLPTPTPLPAQESVRSSSPSTPPRRRTRVVPSKDLTYPPYPPPPISVSPTASPTTSIHIPRSSSDQRPVSASSSAEEIVVTGGTIENGILTDVREKIRGLVTPYTVMEAKTVLPECLNLYVEEIKIANDLRSNKIDISTAMSCFIRKVKNRREQGSRGAVTDSRELNSILDAFNAIDDTVFQSKETVLGDIWVSQVYCQFYLAILFMSDNKGGFQEIDDVQQKKSSIGRKCGSVISTIKPIFEQHNEGEMFLEGKQLLFEYFTAMVQRDEHDIAENDLRDALFVHSIVHSDNIRNSKDDKQKIENENSFFNSFLQHYSGSTNSLRPNVDSLLDRFDMVEYLIGMKVGYDNFLKSDGFDMGHNIHLLKLCIETELLFRDLNRLFNEITEDNKKTFAVRLETIVKSYTLNECSPERRRPLYFTYEKLLKNNSDQFIMTALAHTSFKSLTFGEKEEEKRD